MKNLVEALTFDDIQIVPSYSIIRSRSECVLATNLTRNFSINVPIISSPMDTVTGLDMAVGLAKLGTVGAINRFIPISEQVKAVKAVSDFHNTNTKPVVACIGVNNYRDNLKQLVDAGANVILIDVAHGNTGQMQDTIAYIKNEYNVDVVAGNVATTNGVRNLCEWGADAVRVGIGGGSLCETRIRTGVGIPQATAIVDAVRVAREYNVPVIADGGIRTIADAAKALALGASTVMLGSLLAGTKESPGTIQKIGVWPNEQLIKKYRGSASLENKIENGLNTGNVEGNSKIIPYKGKIKRIVGDMCEGIQSAMSYVGASNMNEFSGFSRFVKVTGAGIAEAKPHLLY